MSRNEQNKKIRAEMNKTENRKQQKKISELRVGFLKRLTKLTNSVLDLTRL